MDTKKIILPLALLLLILFLKKRTEETTVLTPEQRKRTAQYVKSLYWKTIQYFAGLYNLPAKRIASIIAQESAGNPNAKGGVGEIGLMQLRPETIDRINKELKLDKTIIDIQHNNADNIWNKLFGNIYDAYSINYFDPNVNVQYGSAYLRMLVDQVGDLNTATRMYNGSGEKAEQYLKSVKEYEAYF